MRRVVNCELPDRSVRRVQPFHVSMEGLETLVLCRDDADYDAMVKVLCVAARRKNVVVVIYAVVSNHCHVAILAASQDDADAYCQEIKRMYAMWFSRKYKEKSCMQKVDVKAIWLDSDWYVRNALAYIPRNALDNGCNVADYRWSGFRAMFRKGPAPDRSRAVSALTKREREQILHTGDALKDVRWLIDEHGELVPDSFCATWYLEQAYEGDAAFFLKTIGGQNAAEMQSRLIDSPRKKQTDGELYKNAVEACQRWFKSEIPTLSYERKCRLVLYFSRICRTTVPQLARVFKLPREQVAIIIGRR